MSRLLEFYRLQYTDSEGRLLSELWSWTDEQLELTHDFIQWMFPLDEASAFNADAPLVTAADQTAFRSELAIQAAYRKSISRFLKFLGLQLHEDGTVDRGPNFDRRLALWQHMNHNWLRITRLLKSMQLLGFETEATAVWRCLRSLHEQDGLVSESSFRFWREASSGLR